MKRNRRTISTFPFKVKILHEKYEGYSKGNITVHDDVWIGYGAIILSGIEIGQGAVVTENVPPYAVAGRIPAKVISYRFDEQTIQKLLSCDFSLIDECFIKNYIKQIYMDIKEQDLDWFPHQNENLV